MSTCLRPRDDAGLVSQIPLFFLVSALSGLLVAGLALPVVGVVGLAARSGAESFEELPRDLEVPPLPQRSQILDADGKTLASFYYENRTNVPLRHIAPVMRDAIVAIEDSRFYEHEGVDLRGTARAFVNNQTGDSVQGGSTLTQQYVKQVLIETALLEGDDRKREEATNRDGTEGYIRKLRELRYAVALEERLTKKQILERYLNIAYFGSRAYGVEAASRHFFSRPARKLTLPQAALLAGLVKAPGAYDPVRNPSVARKRRNVVIQRMAELGEITPRAAKKAKKSPLGLKVTRVANGCTSSYAPYFCDFVVELLKDDRALGQTQEDRVNMLLRGGLTIRTTLNPRMQAAAQKAVDRHFPRRDASQIGASIVMVEPGTGAIRAMAQNRTWGTKKEPGVTSINYSVDRKYGGSIGFQGGSTFKVFTVAAAVEKGIPLSAKLPAREEIDFDGKFKGCNNGGSWPIENPTKNSTISRESVTVREMLAYSVNTAAMTLEQRTTQCAARDMAVRAGIRYAAPVPPGDDQIKNPGPSFTLGTMIVSPLRMAEAYATFAARGKRCPSYAVEAVENRRGRALDVQRPGCRQVLDQPYADAVNEAAQDVIEYGTGAQLKLGRPVAGKTGTTNENKDVWFVGYTPELATAVWVGDPGAPGRSRRPMKNVVIDGVYRGAAHGSTFAGPVWKDAMLEAVEDLPPRDFVRPDPSALRGQAVRVPDVRGMSEDRAQQVLLDAGLGWTVSEQPAYSTAVPAGAVVFTSPAAGSTVNSGDSVTLYLGNGLAPRVGRPVFRPGQSPGDRPRSEPPSRSNDERDASGGQDDPQ
ncbi:MAG: penicillin-binding protein [Actinomycetota bacterium]|nr:penicillin-binding protein [Actinomycetota bacterium]